MLRVEIGDLVVRAQESAVPSQHGIIERLIDMCEYCVTILIGSWRHLGIQGEGDILEFKEKPSMSGVGAGLQSDMPAVAMALRMYDSMDNITPLAVYRIRTPKQV